MTPLLDVNVLVALAWPSHIHHLRARRWFLARSDVPWASSPATQLGMVRLSANPAVVDPPLTVLDAAMLMAELQALPGHEFWADDVAATDIDWIGIVTYRHVPAAHLVALAERRGGRVATLDRRLAARAGPRLTELID